MIIVKMCSRVRENSRPHTIHAKIKERVRQPVRVGSRRFRGSETWNLGGKRLSFWFEL